jgi:hypothetical protein
MVGFTQPFFITPCDGNSMLQPSPISTTLAFSSRVVWFCSVALILSISALVMTVAVVGFPGQGCA